MGRRACPNLESLTPEKPYSQQGRRLRKLGLGQQLPAATWLVRQGLGGWLGEDSREDSSKPGSWGVKAEVR